MMQQFKSMNDLVAYLGGLEERIKYLEAENQRLRAAPSSQAEMDEKAIAKLVAYFMPQTNVIHPNFLKRAFAIWGHAFVAGLIISIPFTLLYFCVVFWAFSQLGQTP